MRLNDIIKNNDYRLLHSPLPFAQSPTVLSNNKNKSSIKVKNDDYIGIFIITTLNANTDPVSIFLYYDIESKQIIRWQ